MLYNYPVTAQFAVSDIGEIFLHGLVMDLSAAAYLSFLPGLTLAFGAVFFPLVVHVFIRYYTLLLLVFLSLLGLGDLGLYADWGTRINSQIFLYLQNPAGMYAALTFAQLIGLLVAWVLITVCWFWLYKQFVAHKKDDLPLGNWKTIPVFLFLTACLVLPARGGINTSPLNHSHVYFSQQLDANQSAYNYFWNFIYSLGQAKLNKPLVHYMETDEANNILANYAPKARNYPVYIQKDAHKPLNVVFILLESFSSKISEPFGGMPNATPRLNALAKEGIVFSSFYATGNRSDKGMCALIGGYPSVMNNTTSLALPHKMEELFFFPRKFKENGYHLSFYYGGDVNFYNTRSALIRSGFTNITDNTSFPYKIATMQKWGVPDHFLYERMFDELLEQEQPFFSLVYNISSHEPFDIPNYHKIKGDEKSQQYLNAIAYSDSCLGVFVDKLKASPLWDNTLLIITSDHCSLQPEPTGIEDPESYRVPLIWTGGVVDTSFVCNKIAMHNDLGPTILQQMGWEFTMPRFSKNIFGEENYAFYFREMGWGFVAPSVKVFYNTNTKSTTFFKAELSHYTDSMLIFAKAFVQSLHDDFSK